MALGTFSGILTETGTVLRLLQALSAMQAGSTVPAALLPSTDLACHMVRAP